LAQPAQVHLVVSYKPLIDEHVAQVFEHQVEADGVHLGRESGRHVDVREVGHWLFLRERRDHRHVVTTRRQRFHHALVHYPVAEAVDGKHAENVGTVGGG